MNYFESVYQTVKQIPYGKVMSYGAIAALLGNKRKARQVGWALHVNPSPNEIPCYRVVDRFGNVSSAFAFGGGNMQRQLLENEGVRFDENGRVKKEYFVFI